MKDRKAHILAAGLFLILCAALVFVVPSSEILPDAQNAYYTHQAFQASVFAFRPYGAALAFSALLFMLLLLRADASKNLWRFLALSGWLSFFCARMLYVLVNAPFYAYSLSRLSFLKIWEGGLSMTGAVLGVMLAGGMEGRKYEKNEQRKRWNALALALPLAVAAARLGERFSGTGYGLDVEFEGVFSISGEFGPVLNVRLIEAGTGFLLLFFLFIWTKKKKTRSVFPVFLMLYGTLQILMESLRADRHMIWGFVKAEQVFSLLLALCGFVYFTAQTKRIVWAVACTAVTAAAFFGLEKALDRLNLSAGLLYAVYLLAVMAYAALGLREAVRAEGGLENPGGRSDTDFLLK